MTVIHEKVMKFQNGACNWLSLFRDIYAESTKYLTKLRFNEDMQHEFLYWAIVRLEKICRSFYFTGRDFSKYLYQNLDWLWISYCRIGKRHEEREIKYASYQFHLEAREEFWNVEAHNQVLTSFTYGIPEWKNNSFITLSPRSKKILCIALRNCLALDDEACACIAEEINRSHADVFYLVDTLRHILIDELERKRDHRFQKMCTLLDRSKKRLLLKTQSIRLFPKHEQLAKLLNVNKSTIDTILHSCRRLEKQGKML